MLQERSLFRMLHDNEIGQYALMLTSGQPQFDIDWFLLCTRVWYFSFFPLVSRFVHGVLIGVT